MTLRREPLLWSVVVIVLISTYIVYRVEKPDHINAVTIALIVETTVTIVGVLCALFLNFGWHLRVFRGWFVRVPDLRGVWKGTLTPLDADGKEMNGIDCQVIIRQKLFWMSCVLETDKASSQSLVGSAYLDDDTNVAHLAYVYRGWPQLADRKTNPSHDGATLLTQKPDGRLVGTYFTDRCTRGLLELRRS